jgi:hypothetical protein
MAVHAWEGPGKQPPLPPPLSTFSPSPRCLPIAAAIKPPLLVETCSFNVGFKHVYQSIKDLYVLVLLRRRRLRGTLLVQVLHLLPSRHVLVLRPCPTPLDHSGRHNSTPHSHPHPPTHPLTHPPRYYIQTHAAAPPTYTGASTHTRVTHTHLQAHTHLQSDLLLLPLKAQLPILRPDSSRHLLSLSTRPLSFLIPRAPE